MRRHRLLLVVLCVAIVFGKGHYAQKNNAWKWQALGQLTVLGSSIYALQNMWYDKHQQSNFHFYNDAGHWLQMDKVGHFMAGYNLAKLSSGGFETSGLNHSLSVILGSAVSFSYLVGFEILDGKAKKWGFSNADVIANTTGVALYMVQGLLMKRPLLTVKYSYHNTSYALKNPSVLGHSLSERLLKDYNGQTIWLSTSVRNVVNLFLLPKWLNVAVGYGIDGMTGGKDFQLFKRGNRQFYLSLDIDLTQIKTKNKLLKLLFSTLNFIKIPAPTIELSKSGIKTHTFYF